MIRFTQSFSKGAIGLSKKSSHTVLKSSYHSISVPPGTSPLEEQTIKTPLDSSAVVLVVGASRGIGLEFVKQLSSKGCKVIATVRNTDKKINNNKLLSDMNNVELLQMDVSDKKSIVEAAIEVKKRGMCVYVYVCVIK